MYVHAWHSATIIPLVGGSSMDMGKDRRSTGGQFTSCMVQGRVDPEAKVKPAFISSDKYPETPCELCEI